MPETIDKMFKDYFVLLNHSNSGKVEMISENREREIKSSVDLLSFIFGDVSWILTGGLVVPLTIGKFYRNHEDIDIAFSVDDFGDLVGKAKENSYELFVRNVMAKVGFGRKIEVYRKEDIKGVLENPRKRIRLVRCEDRRPVHHRDILDYFDLYPYEIRGDRLVSLQNGLIVPVGFNFGEVYKTEFGAEILMRSLDYVRELKKDNPSEKDRFDMDVIEQYEKTKEPARR